MSLLIFINRMVVPLVTMRTTEAVIALTRNKRPDVFSSIKN